MDAQLHAAAPPGAAAERMEQQMVDLPIAVPQGVVAVPPPSVAAPIPVGKGTVPKKFNPAAVRRAITAELNAWDCKCQCIHRFKIPALATLGVQVRACKQTERRAIIQAMLIACASDDNTCMPMPPKRKRKRKDEVAEAVKRAATVAAAMNMAAAAGGGGVPGMAGAAPLPASMLGLPMPTTTAVPVGGAAEAGMATASMPVAAAVAAAAVPASTATPVVTADQLVRTTAAVVTVEPAAAAGQTTAAAGQAQAEGAIPAATIVPAAAMPRVKAQRRRSKVNASLFGQKVCIPFMRLVLGAGISTWSNCLVDLRNSEYVYHDRRAVINALKTRTESKRSKIVRLFIEHLAVKEGHQRAGGRAREAHIVELPMPITKTMVHELYVQTMSDPRINAGPIVKKDQFLVVWKKRLSHIKTSEAAERARPYEARGRQEHGWARPTLPYRFDGQLKKLVEGANEAPPPQLTAPPAIN